MAFREKTTCVPGLAVVRPGLRERLIILPQKHPQLNLDEVEEVHKEKVGKGECLIRIIQGGQRAQTKESRKEPSKNCSKGSSTENAGRGEQWLPK